MSDEEPSEWEQEWLDRLADSGANRGYEPILGTPEPPQPPPGRASASVSVDDSTTDNDAGAGSGGHFDLKKWWRGPAAAGQ